MRPPPERFRADAERFREYGADGLAGALEACAVYCARWARERQTEELSIPQAAEESGYSETRLRELVRAGAISDGRPPGSQGPITIRRGDLPRKPGAAAPKLDPVDVLAELIQPGSTA